MALRPGRVFALRVLIDILHPAHVHVFKNLWTELVTAGDEVLITAREKDVTVELLEAYAIPHMTLSSQRFGRVGLARELVERTTSLRRVAKRFRPDVMLGVMGAAIAPVGRLMDIPTVVLYDTEAAPSNRWVFPMSTAVATPSAFKGTVRRSRHLTYNGYQELAYLHPSRFEPSATAVAQFGLANPYSLVRFVSWEASHDFGHSAMTLDERLDVIKVLSEISTVWISSEGKLPSVLTDRRLDVPVHRIHDVLGCASLLVGDSGTMASEAALLGTPSIYISSLRAGVIADQQEKLETLRQFEKSDPTLIRAAIDELTALPHLRLVTRKRVNEMVDLTSWLRRLLKNSSWIRL